MVGKRVGRDGKITDCICAKLIFWTFLCVVGGAWSILVFAIIVQAVSPNHRLSGLLPLVPGFVLLPIGYGIVLLVQRIKRGRKSD
jgi:uncharacterized membrane protein (GlpM family)